ncbi:DUF1315 family protein [Alteromonadaceae bacterium M269]|nr:DUF1315 family protein [Alteromonadaceae bacterium M269]
MQLDSLIKSMTPEIYERLAQAVETGKWPDGTKLTEEQRENSMQAVMIYQAKVLASDQHMTVGPDGEIVNKNRQELKQQFSSQPSIARFKQDDF